MHLTLLATLTGLLLRGSPAEPPYPPVRMAVSVRSIRAEAQRQRSTAEGDRYTRVASQAQLYANRDLGVSLRYPKDWVAQEMNQKEGNLTMVALFLSPPTSEKDTARENINFLVEDLPSPALSLQEYTDIAIEQERATFGNYTLLSSSDLLVAGLPAHRITYMASLPDAGSPTAFEQVWLLKDRKISVWTLAATPETFDAYAQTFREMLGTMELE